MSKTFAGIKKCAELLWVGFAMLCAFSVVIGIGVAFFGMICDTIFSWGSFLVKPAAFMIFAPGITLVVCSCLIWWISECGTPKPKCVGGGCHYTGCEPFDDSSSDDSSSDDSDNYGYDDSGPTPGYGGSI